jgi:hypothetical protein
MRRLVLCAALAGCSISAQDDLGESAHPVDVTWMNPVGVATSGNSLTKTDPTGAWNSGAASVEVIDDDGYVEFTTGETTTAKVVGLSVGNSGQNRADIDYGIWLKSDASVGVYEAGTLRGGSFATYAAGDVFRVSVTAGEVAYSLNGAVFYTSTVPAGFPLGVDTSLYTPGATVQSVELVSTILSWQNAVGVDVDGNDLTKTAPESLWNAGASSADLLDGDGYVEFTVGENTTAKMAGLGNGDDSQHHSDIEYAIWLKANGVVGVYEGGVLRGANFGTYAPGDIFRVTVAGGEVRYSRNGGAAFYRSAVAATFPLRFDTSLYTPGATIRDARLVVGLPPCQGPIEVTSGDPLADCTELNGDLTINAGGLVELRTLRVLRGKLTMFSSLSAPALTRVDGNIFAEATATTISLPALTSAYSFSAGQKRTYVQTLDLSSLTFLGGGGGDSRGMFLLSNPKDLVSLSLPSLQSIEGLFQIHASRLNHLLDSVDAPVLESIGGYLWITGFESLTSVRLPSITSLGGNLSIANNPALPECYATRIRDQLLAAGWTGASDTSGNDPGGTCP